MEATHQIFEVSKSTIQKWEKQLKETGDLGKKELHRSFRKIDPEKLKAHVAEHPDAYQSEMAEAFAAKAVFGMRCGGIRLQGKKDGQLPGAGPAKSSGVSGRDQGYTNGKDRICRRKWYI